VNLAEEVLSDLAEEAREAAPRLFAIYGVYHDKILDSDSFVGWGMELADSSLAVLHYLDGTTFRSNSAEQMLRLHQIGAEARLIWLS
jgi:hypothetical protein